VDRGKCRELFRAVRSEGLYTPPSLQGTLTYPTTWVSRTGAASRSTLVNTSHVATITTMVPRAEAQARMERGESPLPQAGTPYAFSWRPLLSPWGAPCNRPPWGTLTAIDLKSRKRARSAAGTTRDLAPFPIWLKLGTPNIGGPVTTGSGLTFIGATTDNYLRAFASARVKNCGRPLPAGRRRRR
jgi:quinoprotein glucose dehydrogenase